MVVFSAPVSSSSTGLGESVLIGFPDFLVVDGPRYPAKVVPLWNIVVVLNVEEVEIAGSEGWLSINKVSRSLDWVFKFMLRTIWSFPPVRYVPQFCSKWRCIVPHRSSFQWVNIWKGNQSRVRVRRWNFSVSCCGLRKREDVFGYSESMKSQLILVSSSLSTLSAWFLPLGNFRSIRGGKWSGG